MPPENRVGLAHQRQRANFQFIAMHEATNAVARLQVRTERKTTSLCVDPIGNRVQSHYLRHNSTIGKLVLLYHISNLFRKLIQCCERLCAVDRIPDTISIVEKLVNAKEQTTTALNRPYLGQHQPIF